ncbi:MAG: WD40 repeat domain-containing protein [Chloroflexota bacterium]
MTNNTISSHNKINVGSIANSTGIAIGENIKNITKITQHITQYIQSQSEAAEIEEGRLLATKRLAEGVHHYVEQLGITARDGSDIPQGGPYRGLLHYTFRDAENFYGRDTAIEELLLHLQRNALTVLQSESGAGKSSLLRAGLSVRLLQDGHLPIILRLNNSSPSLKIKQTLLPELDSIPFWYEASLHHFLHQVTAILGRETIIYVMLDQFEEFFFSGIQKKERHRFIDELAECLDDETLNVRWLLALRSEYFGELATFRPQIEPFNNDYRLERLQRQEALDIINKPVERLGISYETDLQNKLLEDLSERGGLAGQSEANLSGEDNRSGYDDANLSEEKWFAPAQIQLICTSLFDAFQEEQVKANRQSTVISLRLYEEEGGAEGILRHHLQRVLNRRFSQEDDRALARWILSTLVSPTRKRERLTHTELSNRVSIIAHDNQPISDVLGVLQSSRLIVSQKEDRLPQSYYELAHDLLIDEIEIDPDVEMQKFAQEMLDRETEAYIRFETKLRVDKFNLIHEQRQHLVINESAQQLLKVSEDTIHAEKREKRNRRQFIMGASTLSMILAIAAIILGILSVERAAESRSQKLAEESSLKLTDDPQQSLALALEAVDAKHTVAAEDALRQALQAYRQLDHFTHTVTSSVKSVFNADLSQVAIAGNTGKIEVWSTETGEQLHMYKHDAPVRHLAFFRQQDHLLIAVDAGGQTIIRDLDRNKAIYVDHEPNDYDIRAMAVHPEEQSILVSSPESETIRMLNWHKETLNTLGTPVIPSELVYSNDKRYLVAGSGNGRLYLWSLEKRVHWCWQGHTNFVMDIVFHPSLPLFISGSQDKTVRVWSIPDWEPTGKCLTRDKADELLVDEFEDVNGTITALSLNHDGSCLAAASEDGSVVIWYLSESDSPHLWLKPGQKVMNLYGHNTLVHGLAFEAIDDVSLWPIEPCGKRLWTSSDDGTVRYWNIGSTEEVQTITAHREEVEIVEYSPDGRFFATASGDGTAKIFDSETLALVHTVTHTKRVDDVAFSPDSNYLVTASYDGSAVLVSLANGFERKHFSSASEQGEMYSATFTPNGDAIVTVSEDNIIRVWDIKTQSVASEQKTIHTDKVYSIRFSVDGDALATASRDGRASLIEFESGQLGQAEAFTHTFASVVSDVIFSTDGTYLMTATFNGDMCFLTLTSQPCVTPVKTHTGPIYGLAVGHHRDNQPLLATASGDSTAKLWNAETLERITTLTGNVRGVNSISLHPQNNIIATAGDDGTVRIYTLDIDRLQALAKQRLE